MYTQGVVELANGKTVVLTKAEDSAIQIFQQVMCAVQESVAYVGMCFTRMDTDHSCEITFLTENNRILGFVYDKDDGCFYVVNPAIGYNIPKQYVTIVMWSLLKIHAHGSVPEVCNYIPVLCCRRIVTGMFVYTLNAKAVVVKLQNCGNYSVNTFLRGAAYLYLDELFTKNSRGIDSTVFERLWDYTSKYKCHILQYPGIGVVPLLKLSNGISVSQILLQGAHLRVETKDNDFLFSRVDGRYFVFTGSLEDPIQLASDIVRNTDAPYIKKISELLGVNGDKACAVLGALTNAEEFISKLENSISNT